MSEQVLLTDVVVRKFQTIWIAPDLLTERTRLRDIGAKHASVCKPSAQVRRLRVAFAGRIASDSIWPVLAAHGLEADRLEELERAFERDGFVNGGPVLEANELAALKADLEPYVDVLRRGDDPRGVFPGNALDLSRAASASHYQITALWKISQAFRRLIEHPRIVAIAAHLTRSETIQLWCDTVQYKPPQRGAHFQWHQDAPYHEPSLRPSERLISAWVAFDDADEETGCMWMVPGSHRWGVREVHLWDFGHLTEAGAFGSVAPPAQFPEIAGKWRGAVPCRVKAGEVHFHHGLTWHGSPSNHSMRPRRAYSLHYIPQGVVVSPDGDPRVPLKPGTDMSAAGPEFPIVYRSID